MKGEIWSVWWRWTKRVKILIMVNDKHTPFTISIYKNAWSSLRSTHLMPIVFYISLVFSKYVFFYVHQVHLQDIVQFWTSRNQGLATAIGPIGVTGTVGRGATVQPADAVQSPHVAPRSPRDCPLSPQHKLPPGLIRTRVTLHSLTRKTTMSKMKMTVSLLYFLCGTHVCLLHITNLLTPIINDLTSNKN